MRTPISVCALPYDLCAHASASATDGYRWSAGTGRGNVEEAVPERQILIPEPVRYRKPGGTYPDFSLSRRALVGGDADISSRRGLTRRVADLIYVGSRLRAADAF